MKQVSKNKKSLLIKYGICLGVAMAIVIFVCAINGFFSDDLSKNLRVLSDATFTASALFTMLYGLMFISSEGGFLGIGFTLGRAARALFVPGGRRDTETYAEYCERKTNAAKKTKDKCVLLTGLLFLLISIIFTVIWHNV